ncbi:MAG TPA: GNAT family N-acetyltransferase [Candidatus Lumbricidophila sp.]|nr:GNAT family N-acetyltransferase [Candidatus Lumbricidophila sp.]
MVHPDQVARATPTAQTGWVLLTTARLRIREMTRDDLPALRAIMQDPVTMTAHEGAFDDAAVDGWLDRTLARYAADGYALWAVALPETDEMIGQCGITNQHILGADVLEVGYLFRRDVWGNGYATEAAAACRDYAFTSLGADRVWAQVRDTNIASMNVAIRLGMTVRGRFIKEYRGVTMPHLAFAVAASAATHG